MLQPLRKFFFSRRNKDIARAYALMFTDEGTPQFVEAIREAERILIDARELFTEIGPSELGNKIIIASTIPPIELSIGGEIPTTVDLSIMDKHVIPRLQETIPLLDNIDMRAEIDTKHRIDSQITSPLLLTTVNELNNAWFYMPNERIGNADLAIASLLVELTVFGRTIRESDETKRSIAEQAKPLLETFGNNGTNIDELFAEIGSIGIGKKTTPSGDDAEAINELSEYACEARIETYKMMWRDFVCGDFSGKMIFDKDDSRTSSAFQCRVIHG